MQWIYFAVLNCFRNLLNKDLKAVFYYVKFWRKWHKRATTELKAKNRPGGYYSFSKGFYFIYGNV